MTAFLHAAAYQAEPIARLTWYGALPVGAAAARPSPAFSLARVAAGATRCATGDADARQDRNGRGVVVGGNRILPKVLNYATPCLLVAAAFRACKAIDMWKLRMRDDANSRQWAEVGQFETIQSAARRVLEIEDRPGSMFFRVYADPAVMGKSDADILSRLEYQGEKGFYVLTRGIS